ncbi:DUF6933 domain-containing protein [Macrococcus lamae]|uniref:DUF6933 domain-containing protein n=1 Tax=Macrococcus lamae TaxID=198484 RepID=A0A4R6BSH3_9STAP|nr:hypothetical protein [Macrococcus lamae]TDM06997.1 hypothetical protein ERX29_09820 [Macrococcus lamae]
MIINPTKKTLPLFNQLTPSTSRLEAESAAAANPLYSWHATYINVDRKKVLVLVNDLTYTPVIITDVKAQDRKQLDVLIEQGIRQQFNAVLHDPDNIERYLTNARTLEVNTAYNRSVISAVNQYVKLLSYQHIDLTERFPQPLMDKLSDYPFLKPEYRTGKSALKQAFKAHIKLRPVVPLEHQKMTRYKVTRTWQPFSHWDDYAANGGWFEGYETIAAEVQDNNQKLLESFRHYLINHDKMTEQTASEHVENIAFFVDVYLLNYGIRTPVTDMRDPYDFLDDFLVRKALWVGSKEVRQFGTSLRRFYTFLFAAREITKHERDFAKEGISYGVEEALQRLEHMTDDFWD